MSGSVRLALLEACQQVDPTTTGQYVVSPGQVVVDERGTQVVHASGEVVSGDPSGLVGVGVALDGVTAGDVGVARDEAMDVALSPVELPGPGEWPLVVVYDRSIESEIVVTERDETRQFTVHVSSDCDDSPGTG